MEEPGIYDRFCNSRFKALEDWQVRQNGSLKDLERMILASLVTLAITLCGVIANLGVLLFKVI